MVTEEFKRKLSAILSADVAGYSRLMGEDDDATVRTLTGHRSMMSSIIRQHQGRVVDSPGDNLLAEFESVLQGVNCAVEIQRELAERNAELPDDRIMEYRIGVNVGDVIKEGDRIYGDGVNIAARLESLAEPGEICISGFVYHQVKNRLKLEYEYLGEQSVKNIKEPVPVYRVLSFPRAPSHRLIEAKKPPEGERTARSFQDKPSIAVLPFVNMSNEPEQEYFSDGITEEIIGALAKLEGLKVISRTSTFYFKGKDVDLRTVGEKLKVDNVLEGSVRKAGDKLRISAQLIKVADDTHLWADSFNREMKDVFDIQEEISQAIVKNLKVKLLNARSKPLVKDYTQNTKTYELYLKGKYFFNKGPVEFGKAIEYMEKAIATDPDYAPAYSFLASIHMARMHIYSLPPEKMSPMINSLSQRAFEIDDKYAISYVERGNSKMIDYDWKGAESDLKRALELNPGLSDCYGGYSYYLMARGRFDEAIVVAKRGIELDPLASFHRARFGDLLVSAGQFDQAIASLQETLKLDPNHPMALGWYAIAYAGKGMYDEAISRLQRVRKIIIFEAYLGNIYVKAGNLEEAQKILNDFLARAKKVYFSPYMIALVYSGLGEKDKAFIWLDEAYKARDPWQHRLKAEIAFHSLHSDPRWAEQMRKRGLTDYFSTN